MKHLKTMLAIFFLVLISSCSKDEGEASTDSPTGGSNNSNKVFVVGIEQKGSLRLPIILTNGVKNFLPIVADTEVDHLKIVVQNNDVYVTGVEKTSTNKMSIVLWKNGVQSRFSEAANNVEISQMIVDNGNVYVFGKERLADEGKFRYWKNGVATTIIDEYVTVLDDFKGNYVGKMVVTNNDVYCIGGEWNATGKIRTAKFWKNGVPTSIMDFKNNLDYLADIQVNGTDVCILYNQLNPTTSKQEVKLWKNNAVSIIASGTNSFFASEMVIKDGVEHILIEEGISFDGTKLVYLKNRVKTEITDGTSDVGISYIKVDGSNVCVAYEADSEGDLGVVTSGKYWFNGETKTLNGEGNFEIDVVFLAGKDVYMTSARGLDPKLWVNGTQTTLPFDATKDYTIINDVFVTQ